MEAEREWSGRRVVRPVDPCGRVPKLVAKLVATAPAQRRIRADASGSRNAETCGYGLRRTPKSGDLFPDTEEVTGSSPVSPTHEGAGQRRCASLLEDHAGGDLSGRPGGGVLRRLPQLLPFLPCQPEPVDTVACTLLWPRPGQRGRTSVPGVGRPRCVLGGVPAAVQLGQGQVGGELAAAEPDRRPSSHRSGSATA